MIFDIFLIYMYKCYMNKLLWNLYSICYVFNVRWSVVLDIHMFYLAIFWILLKLLLSWQQCTNLTLMLSNLSMECIFYRNCLVGSRVLDFPELVEILVPSFLRICLDRATILRLIGVFAALRLSFELCLCCGGIHKHIAGIF